METSDRVHPLHARQSGAGHRHPAGPQPEVERLAVRQDPEVRLRQILLLQAVLVVSQGQNLLDTISTNITLTLIGHYYYNITAPVLVKTN